MNTPTRILPATEEHLPTIAALAGVIWRACYPAIISMAQIEYMLPQMYSPVTLREEILERGIRFERLLCGDELIGFESFGPTEEARTFKLHKLYLHPEWHGHGFGTLLLRHCETEVRKMGARKLILSVNKRNSKAMSVYRRNSFQIIESVVTDIGNGFVMDDYLMGKELSDSNSEVTR